LLQQYNYCHPTNRYFNYYIEFTSAANPQSQFVCPVHQLPKLHFQMVVRKASAL